MGQRTNGYTVHTFDQIAVDIRQFDPTGNFDICASGDYLNCLLNHLGQHVVQHDPLGLTFNGKLDRLALPVPAEADIRDETPLALPRTSIEVQIADIWQTVLGIKQIGIHDSFFDLGGNSLLATQIVLRVREALHVTIALHDIFRAPTVADLAVFVAQQQTRLTPHPSTLKPEIDEETAQNVLVDFSSLSEEEVDALYQQILEGNTHGNTR